METPITQSEYANEQGSGDECKVPKIHDAAQSTSTVQCLYPSRNQTPMQGIGANHYHIFNPQMNNVAISPTVGLGFEYAMNNGIQYHGLGYVNQQAGFSVLPPVWNPSQFGGLHPIGVNYQNPDPQDHEPGFMGRLFGQHVHIGLNYPIAHPAVLGSTISDNQGQNGFSGPPLMPFNNDPADRGSNMFMTPQFASNQASNNNTFEVTPSPETSASYATQKTNQKVNVVKITRAQADERSIPPPGDELTALVEEAKNQKEIPRCHKTAGVRYVDGQWMIPTPCENAKKGSQCNRALPTCQTCNNKNFECGNDGFMMSLRAPKNHRADTIKSEVQDDTQNALPLGEAKKRKRSGGMIINYSDALVDTIEESSDLDDVGNARSAALGYEDDDFSPGGEQMANQSSEIAPVAKRRGRAKKGGGRAPKKSNSKKQTAHINAQQGKPEPSNEPEVWASRRQQLCETLPYFNSHESGAYTYEGILYAMLIDQGVGKRDKFTDQIIITKCGGGRAFNEDGDMVQSKSQDGTSGFGLAFVRSMKDRRPVAVIAGQGNSASPSALPHPYNVLAWFHVTDVWCEKVDSVATLVARLEKIDLYEMSWWAPKGSILKAPNFVAPKAKEGECSTCKKSSKVIFNQGFTCLNGKCKKFFDFGADMEDTLDYNNDFLYERTQYQGTSPAPLSPSLITLKDGDFGYEAKYRKGIVCLKCRCCIRRIHWNFWACEQEECDFIYRIPQKIASPEETITEGMDEESQRNRNKSFCHPDIPWTLSAVGPYDIREYTIPGGNGEICGFVRHFKSRGIINEQPDGPDDLFEQMQAGKFDLKRNAARLPGNVKETLTSHWATNWGAPYKYGVVQDSRSFDEAPEVILKAVMRLTWAGKHALTENHEPFQPFNEMLTIGYFEETHIGFHDDGEKELGPTIATLSLGADATMEFRPKKKNAIGQYRGVDHNDNKGSKKKQNMLVFTLRHGDIVIMHGRDIQKYYEHGVKPHGKLRYAMTCRYIDPAMMDSEEKRVHTAKAGKLPAIAESFQYDGDINAKRVNRKLPVDPVISLGHRMDAMRRTGSMSVGKEREFLSARLATLSESQATSTQIQMIHEADDTIDSLAVS